jgi:prepilin-type N-terminal cleavage/methylation domain-containing protein
MKKAFTMLELVFVIVVIGILAAVIIPRIESHPVREAAIQLVSHIRYTQHLAMVDDKYNAADANWFKHRWYLEIGTTVENNGRFIYGIQSDDNGDGVIAQSEYATNPQDKNKILVGWLLYPNSSTEMDLGRKYGITNVTLSNNCRTGTRYIIIFDHLGRPMKGDLATYADPYPNNMLLSADCTITLEGSDENESIIITRETGYAYID